MITAFERLIAIRYLRAKRVEGFISVSAFLSLLGILLGVATLIIVMSVMSGFRADLLGKIIGLNGHIIVQSARGEFLNWQDILLELDTDPLVLGAVPLVRGQVMISVGASAGAAEIRGMRQKDLESIDAIRQNDVSHNGIFGGTFREDQAGNGVLLGYRLAHKLGVGAGHKVTLLSPRGVTTQRGTVPTLRAYDVIGIVHTGKREADETWVLMSLEDAQSFFNTGASITRMDLAIQDPYAARKIADHIQERLGEDYRVNDWLTLNSSFVNALAVERNVMAIILSLIILVAAFNVISSQIMLTQEKMRGIAVLRTMGVTKNSILMIFLMTGSSVGIVGTLLGAGLGVALSLNIEVIAAFVESVSPYGSRDGLYAFLSRLPANVEFSQVCLIFLFAFMISVLSALYPAWRAARFDPVMVLRYE